jgi:hypothetical protein
VWAFICPLLGVFIGRSIKIADDIDRSTHE